jgi:hypothetical protein
MRRLAHSPMAAARRGALDGAAPSIRPLERRASGRDEAAQTRVPLIARRPAGQDALPATHARRTISPISQRRRARGTASRPASAPAQRRTIDTIAHRPAELVWAAAAGAANAPASPFTTRGASHAVATPAPATPASVRAETAVTSRAQQPSRTTVLDPALVDRLADDVIKRVERRIRIERERRGL